MKEQSESIIRQFARQLSAGEMAVYGQFACLSVGILGFIAALIGPLSFGLVIVAAWFGWRVYSRRELDRRNLPDGPLPDWIRVEGERIGFVPVESPKAEPDPEPAAEPEPVYSAPPAVKIVSVRVNRPVPMLPAKRSREAVENEKLRERLNKVSARLDVVREKLTRRRERQRLALERAIERERKANSLAWIVRRDYGGLEPMAAAKHLGFKNRKELIANGFPVVALVKSRDTKHEFSRMAIDELSEKLAAVGHIRHGEDFLEAIMAGKCSPIFAGGLIEVQSELDNLDRATAEDAVADDEFDISFNPAEFAA